MKAYKFSCLGIESKETLCIVNRTFVLCNLRTSYSHQKPYPQMRSLNPSSERFDLAYINTWILDSDLRGQGLGDLVMKKFYAKFKSPTLLVLIPTVIAETSLQSLVRFYARQGMVMKKIDRVLHAFKVLNLDQRKVFQRDSTLH